VNEIFVPTRTRRSGRLKTENHDQKTGIDIVRKALSTPARQIAVNAGEDGSIDKISDNDMR
jgi:chaperonin GroEL (HSP60 family)